MDSIVQLAANMELVKIQVPFRLTFFLLGKATPYP